MRITTQLSFLLFPTLLVQAIPFTQRTQARLQATPTPTLLPRALEKRKDDVIVNIGAITTLTTVVESPVPTTVFVECTTEGKVITSKVISTETTILQTVVTQTAVETQIVKETVQQGVTIPVTVVTTGYEIDLQTEIVQIQSTVLETKVNVVTNTILGFEKVDTETVVETKTKGEEAAEKPTPTAQDVTPTQKAIKSEDDGQYTPEETSSAKEKTSLDSSKIAEATSGLEPSLNLNNSASADSDASASLSNDNSNTNSVNVTLSSALSDSDAAKDWVSQGNNGWILGGGIVAVVLIIVGILAIAIKSCSSNGRSSNGGSAQPSNQSVLISNPPSARTTIGGIQPQPVMSSLGSRPQRRQRKEYSRVGGRQQEAESSELSSSDSEIEPPKRRSTVGRIGSRRTPGRK
ncbi:uncharacterized protein JCM6883_000714 [Sporobolomyces salmoneus]|uniref:uncharacterized protein n=1 Tax=Sporobolomyces salmoneus TaxID=183962 RepID=UPI0031703C6A